MFKDTMLTYTNVPYHKNGDGASKTHDFVYDQFSLVWNPVFESTRKDVPNPSSSVGRIRKDRDSSVSQCFGSD